MPARSRTLHISLNPVKLVLCIALGIWLGFLAVAGTAWFGYRHLVSTAWEQVGQSATAPLGSPVGPAPTPAPAPHSNAQMFERYQQNQGAAQQRNAPNEKARQNMERFCN